MGERAATITLARHTPGPWLLGSHTEVQHDYPYRFVGWSVPIWSADRKHSIATIYNRRYGGSCHDVARRADPDFLQEARANARLIAASPELLDALNGLIGLVQILDHRADVPQDVRTALKTNHRYTDAVALVARLEGGR